MQRRRHQTWQEKVKSDSNSARDSQTRLSLFEVVPRFTLFPQGPNGSVYTSTSTDTRLDASIDGTRTAFFQTIYSASAQSKLKPAKLFKTAVDPAASPTPGGRSPPNQGIRHITGISFDDRGDQLITAAEDETFRLYNCKTGKQVLSTRCHPL